MKLPTTILVLVIAVFGVSAQSGRVQQPKPTPTATPGEDDRLRVVTEEIKINVSAFNLKGEFFDGVQPSDVVINENGSLHQPTSVRRIPANVLILLDTGGEERSAKDFRTTRETARSLIANLQRDDSVALISYNDGARVISEWTTDRAALEQALDKTLDFGRRSEFVAALNLAVDFFEKSGTENRHLVLITDGLDSRAKEAEREAALKRVLTTDINVHVFSYTKLELAVVEKRRKFITRPGPAPRAQLPPGAQVPVQGQTQTYPTVVINTDREMMRKIKERGTALEKSEKSLSELAADTNGIFFLPESAEEMIAKTAFLARNIDAQYVVTYTPKRPLAESKPGEVRTVEATSKRDGLDILGRRKVMGAPASLPAGRQ